MAYSYDQIFAADPANPSNIAQNAAITIFAPGDVTMTPLTITDPDGQPLANPIPVNANGFGSAFAHATLDRVAWAGGGFTGFFTSYEGMKNEAVAARSAAEAAATTAGADAAAVATAAIGTATDEATAAAASAAASATSAAEAAATASAPADTAIAAAVNNTGSASRAALNATFVPKWKPNTAYATAQPVLNPDGDVVTAKVAFTSGATYSAANWNLSGAYLNTQNGGNDVFKGMNQRLNMGDVVGAPGSIVNMNHYADGTGNVASPGQTYGLDIHNYPGAQSGLVLHQYSSLSRLVQLDNTGTQPALEIHNTQNLVINPGSDGTGDFVLLRDHGTAVFRIDKDLVFRLGGTKVPTFLHTAAKALSVQTSSAFNGEAMDVTKAGTGTGTALKVNNSGTGAGVQINQTGAGQALRIVANVAANAGVFAALIEGYDYGPSLTTTADGGTTFTLTKNGTGNGTGLSIVNKGTGNSVEVRDASAQLFAITAGGVPKWTAAANQQTTVGATGAAAALPAQPAKYLKVQDSAGTTYVIPVYNA